MEHTLTKPLDHDENNWKHPQMQYHMAIVIKILSSSTHTGRSICRLSDCLECAPHNSMVHDFILIVGVFFITTAANDSASVPHVF